MNAVDFMFKEGVGVVEAEDNDSLRIYEQVHLKQMLSEEDRLAIAESLFGCVPATMTLEEVQSNKTQ